MGRPSVDAAGSRGLGWELEEASTPSNRPKLIIALPIGRTRMKRAPLTYFHVSEVLLDYCQHHLPRYQGDLAFIRFRHDGIPVEHRLVNTFSLSRLVLGRARATLIEVLRNAGYHPRPYRKLLAKLAAAVCGVFTVVFSDVCATGVRLRYSR